MLGNEDLLGTVVQDALAVVLDGRLRNLETQLTRKVENAESRIDDIRVNNLRGDLLTRTSDFSVFSGLPYENFTEWAKKLEKQMILKGIRNDDDALKQIFLEFHLKGDALTKFENILNSDDPPTTYAQLLQAMQLAFPSQRDSLHHRQILKDRKQKRTETVTAYFNELEKLGRLAYPNLDSNARNTFLESVFLEGLQTDVRRALKFKRFPDLKSLIDEATFVEQEILRDESNIIPCTAAKYGGQTEQVFAHQPPKSNGPDMNIQIEKLNDAIEKLTIQLGQKEMGINSKPKTCFLCGKIGHYAKDCRSKPPCSICGRQNHVERECRVKCTHCKRSGHKSDNCRLKDTQCHKCKRQGHLSRDCPQENRQSPRQNNIAENSGSCQLDIDGDDPGMRSEASKHHSCVCGFVSSNTIMLCLITILGFLSGSNAQMYQMCGTSLSGHAIEIPKSVSCVQPPVSGTPLTVIGHVYTPRSSPKTTHGYKCTIRKRKICTQTSFFGSKSIIFDQTKIENLTPFGCSKFWETKNYKGQTLNQTKNGLWSTNNKLAIEYKWCCFDNCQEVENLIIEEGQVASWDGISIISTLGDLGGCKANAGQCATPDGVIMWEEKPLEKICPLEFKNSYRIDLTNSHALIEDLQAAFSLKNRSYGHPNCPEITNSIQTEQGIVIKIDQMIDRKIELDPIIINGTASGLDYDESDPINGKLNYLIEKIRRFELQNFRNVWSELCRQAQRHLDLVWQLLRLDATLGARAFLQRTDIVAEFTGEAVTIWSCRQVNATVVYKDYQVGTTCFRDLPVRIDKELMFVTPGGVDLATSSQKVDCNHRHIPLFKVNDTWVSMTGKAHVSRVPLEILWNGNFSVFHFNTPTIFHDKIAAVSTNLNYLKEFMFKTHDLELVVKRLVNYTSEMSLHSSSVYEVLSGSGKALGSTLNGAGLALEHVIVGSHNSLTDGLNNLLKGPLQMLINLAVMLMLIVGALYCFYLLRGCNFPKRPRNLAYELPVRQNRHNIHPVLPPVAPSFGQALVDLVSLRGNQIRNGYVMVPNQRAPSAPKLELINCIVGEKGKIPLIKVTLNRKIDVTAMIDCGSTITLINPKVVEGLELCLRPPDGRTPLTLDNHSIQLLGSVRITIEFCGIQLSLLAHVPKNCNSELLLGMDLLTLFPKWGWNHEKGHFKLGEIKVPCVIQHHYSNKKRSTRIQNVKKSRVSQKNFHPSSNIKKSYSFQNRMNDCERGRSF